MLTRENDNNKITITRKMLTIKNKVFEKKF